MTVVGDQSVEALLQESRDAQRCGRFDAMLESAEHASETYPQSREARFRLLECLLYCGRPDRVRAELEALEARAGSDHALWCKLGEFHTHCTDHDSALRCYRRAAELDPHNADYLFSLSAAEIATGDLADAERHLSEVIAANPHDYDAYRNRSTLRKQLADDNHIAEIEALLESGVRTPAGEVQLCYALSKEYEDLGDYEHAFAYLKRGADKRRSILNYRVGGDIALLAKLRSAFTREFLDAHAGGCDAVGPVFVLGLPRSGTTLIDRILSSHSRVESLGEINDFAYSLMHVIGRSANKLELVDLATRIDFTAFGRRYVDGIRRYGCTAAYLIDKTPLNYLYIGLVRLALPNARIVHIERNPMDSCFGMYRSLFRAGYPFSYDFDDLGKYYVAYRQLMDHWREVVPGFVFDVHYEELVADPERVSRSIVEYCGLAWEPTCLEFHQNPAPVATASSAQVREPMYRDAVDRWRRYERELAPLADILRREGIWIDAR